MTQSNSIGAAGGVALVLLALACSTHAESEELRLSDVLATNAVFSRTVESWINKGVRRSMGAFKDSTAMYGGSREERLLFRITNPEFSLELSPDGISVIGFSDRIFINRGPQRKPDRTRLDPSSPELLEAVARLTAIANSPNIEDFQKQIAAGLKFSYQRSSSSWLVNLVREWNGFRVPSDRLGIMVEDGTGLVVIFQDYRFGKRFDSLNVPRIAGNQAEATARPEVLRRVQLYQPQLREPVISLEEQAALHVEYFPTDDLERTASEEIRRAIERDLQPKRTHWYPRLAFRHFFVVRGRSSDAKGIPVVVSEFVYVDATTGELLPPNVRK